uniref:Putative secreted protein n=1 Tax=Panstrongylus lignarius TaxID=156445 RepID=A0A224XZX1_9HEMI
MGFILPLRISWIFISLGLTRSSFVSTNSDLFPNGSTCFESLRPSLESKSLFAGITIKMIEFKFEMYFKVMFLKKLPMSS